MDETVTAPIQKVIENPTDTTSWILISIAILINIFQLWQNKRIAKAVEKFKDDLAKSQYKFTRHAELQIECLKNMYDKVVEFHFAYTTLTEPRFKTHTSLKSNIVSFQDIFFEMITYCHKNKILLTDDIGNQIRVIHSKFYKIDKLFQSEFDNLSLLEESKNSNKPENLYDSPTDEVNSIQLVIDRIKKNFDEKSFEADINKLRGLVETYFKKLVG